MEKQTQLAALGWMGGSHTINPRMLLLINNHTHNIILSYLIINPFFSFSHSLYTLACILGQECYTIFILSFTFFKFFSTHFHKGIHKKRREQSYLSVASASFPFLFLHTFITTFFFGCQLMTLKSKYQSMRIIYLYILYIIYKVR